MTNYYILIIYIVPLISVDGQASPRLFIAPEIRHEKISYSRVTTLPKIFFQAKSKTKTYSLGLCNLRPETLLWANKNFVHFLSCLG